MCRRLRYELGSNWPMSVKNTYVSGMFKCLSDLLLKCARRADSKCFKKKKKGLVSGFSYKEVKDAWTPVLIDIHGRMIYWHHVWQTSNR